MRVVYGVSERRVAETTRFWRSMIRYRSKADPQTELRMRLKDLAAVRVRYGYARLHMLLRREGWMVNHKRIYRLYKEEGLAIRSKTPRRRRACRTRGDRPEIGAVNEVWAMDFMSDALFDGRAFRLLTIVDCHSRESLAIEPQPALRAPDVIAVLDRIVASRGAPKSIRVDNGPEFAGRMLDQWAYFNGVALDFSRPGKPTDNSFIESFNARVRAECLNASWFLSMEDACARIEHWRQDYNHYRPHSALGGLTPAAFAADAQKAETLT